MTPRIAIPVPTATDEPYNQLNWQSYADAVLASGGDPIRLPLSLSRKEALALAATCHGICLTGSPADVDPSKYGQPIDDATAPADPAREAIDEILLADALRTHKPLLAICFGAQIFNVFHGGTLVQDLAPMPVNHSAGRAVAVAHTAAIPPDSFLATLVDPKEAQMVDGLLRLPVNSSHHQAIGIPGESLKITARCPQDGVIEAVEFDPDAYSGFALGIQWHPERTFHTSPTSRNLFTTLVRRSAAWQPLPEDKEAR